MKKPALLLLHGICNNANLFAIPGHGLGHYLSEHFNIFPVNYPIEAHHDKPWDFDFHLHQDMPVIWQQVCRDAGEKPFVFGYSMGGMLAMAARALGVIDPPAIVAAASPFTFSMIPLYPPLMRTCVRLSTLTGYRTVPIKLLGRILCAVMAASAPCQAMFDLNLFRYLIKTSTVNVPVETILQTLLWTKTRKFTDRTGQNDYLKHFSEITTPACLIYGNKDRIAPENTVEVGYHAISSRYKALVKIPGGTHMNMTAGANARKISDITHAWCRGVEVDSDEYLRAIMARG